MHSAIGCLTLFSIFSIFNTAFNQIQGWRIQQDSALRGKIRLPLIPPPWSNFYHYGHNMLQLWYLLIAHPESTQEGWSVLVVFACFSMFNTAFNQIQGWRLKNDCSLRGKIRLPLIPAPLSNFYHYGQNTLVLLHVCFKSEYVAN